MTDTTLVITELWKAGAHREEQPEPPFEIPQHEIVFIEKVSLDTTRVVVFTGLTVALLVAIARSFDEYGTY